MCIRSIRAAGPPTGLLDQPEQNDFSTLERTSSKMKTTSLQSNISRLTAVAVAALALTACGGGGGGGGGALPPIIPIGANPGAPVDPDPGNPGQPGNPDPSDNETYTVSVLAGSPGGTEGGDDGTGTSAKFSCPTAIAVGPLWSLVVADGASTGAHRIRIIEKGTVTTKFTYNANASSISGIMVDSFGRFIVSSPDNDYLSAYSSDGKNEERWGVGSLMGPGGAILSPNGEFIIADSKDYKIKKLDNGTGTVNTFVGSIKGDADGGGSNAQFKYPKGIALDETTGNVYVADPEGHTVRKITPLGEVTTLAGSGNAGHVDGQGKAASLNAPVALSVGPKGEIFVAERGSHTIRKISDTGLVSTIAGVPNEYGSANGKGSEAKFRSPEGLTVDANGVVYVADCGNNQIRKLLPSSAP